MPYQLLTSIFIQTTSNRSYCITFGTILKLLSIHQIPVTFLFSAVAPSVTINPPPLTLIFLISCNNLYNIHTRAAEALFDRSGHNQICHHCLCGASTHIVCKEHVHVKHANSREVWGHAPPENF